MAQKMAGSLSKALRGRLTFHQCTNEAKLDSYAFKNKAAYLGIDPTAPSLHVGHLVGVMALRRLSRLGGFKPIALIGGATALIGDPTGRLEERPVLAEEFVMTNVERIERTLKNLLGPETTLVNNYSWYAKDMSAFHLLRDIGRHFRVSSMLAREAVKSRLEVEGGGLSFTELAYQILQANDFRKLYSENDCVVQIGGSDQWGNIISGVELIQKLHPSGDIPVGLTVPLVTVGGVKLGKTAGNVSIWLDRDMTTDYDFFQYFMRLDDKDCENMLYMLTDEQTIPDVGERQKRLAYCVTELVRGKPSAENAERLSHILFSGSYKGLSARELLDAAKSAGVETVRISSTELEVAKALVEAKLTTSLSEGRRLLQSGAVLANGVKVSPGERAQLSRSMFIEEKLCLIRVGKSKWGLIEIK